MKRKEIKFPLLLLAIFPLFMLANSIQVDAASAVPILQSPDVTIIDGSGNITGGNKDVNIRNAIPLGYVGSSMASDIKVLDSNGVLQPSSSATTYAVGTTFKVSNAGYYDGKPIVFAFKSINMKLRVFATSDATGNYVYPYPTGQLDNSNPRYEMWVEDTDGNEIKDPNVQFIFPIKTMYGGSGVGVGSYMIFEFIAGGPTAGNLLVQNATNDDALALPYYSVDITNTYTRVISTMGTMYANYMFPAAGHVQLYSEPLSGTYPNGVPFPSKAQNNSYRFLNSAVPTLIKLYNAAPVINSTVNDSTFQADVSITQSLYAQSSSSFYPTSLDITATLPDVLKTADSIGNLKVTDQTGKDITSQVTMTSESNGTITVSIPQATLASLGSNIITIQGMVDIDRTNKNTASYYDSDTGYFVFPETAKNTDSDVTNSGEAKVKVPGPTADPVPQRVGQGTSTDDLLPRDLVTNLDSLVPDDVVTVVGFKAKKTFSTVGADTAIVQIKSQKTGIVSDITVPITVVAGSVVVDQANLSWSNMSIVSEKSEDVSSVATKLTLPIYWQTTFTNKQYQLVVKKGTTILTQKLASSVSTGDNSWLAESLDIPLDQLSAGANDLTVGIYALKEDGSLLGGPLSFVNLTVNVVNDNATLSWTNSSTNIQKTKGESLDKSTMDDSLVETLYWETTTENRNYLLVTKDSTGAVVTSQAVANNATVNQFQQATISLPTSAFNYGDNVYKVGIYAKDSTGAATGEPLDEITLTVTVTGTLQLLSVPTTIDFNLQKVDPRKAIRVDDPTVDGSLIVADTRNGTANNWVVKIALTKPLQSTNSSGKQVILPNALKYKAPGEDEFIVTSDSAAIESKVDSYGKFNISSEWGSGPDNPGFKLETLPSDIGTLGEYTGEITYTISDTFEP